MFCKYCGKEIDNDSKFCKFCGKTLDNNQVNNNLSESIKKARTVGEYGEDAFVDLMDTIKFGKYAQSDSRGKKEEEIEWLVLEKKNDKALLIAKNILDQVPFYYPIENEDIDDKKLAYYSQSFVRKFLNDEFISKAFNDEELENILVEENEITMYNDENWIQFNNLDELKKKFNTCYFDMYDNKDGILREKIMDRVFIISYENYVKYFGKENIAVKRINTTTRYYISDSEYKETPLFSHSHFENSKGAAHFTNFSNSDLFNNQIKNDLKNNLYDKNKLYNKSIFTGDMSIEGNNDEKGGCWYLGSIDFSVKNNNGEDESYRRPIFVGTHGDVACANAGCSNGYGLRPSIWVKI